MTEEEAKTKWCPMARVIESANDPSFNRIQYKDKDDVEVAHGSYCIATDCMMWEWLELPGEGEGYCGFKGV